MSEPRAIQFVWDKEAQAMFPLGVHATAAACAQYKHGERVVLVPHKERSGKSHRHLYAAIKEGFENLPEKWADLFSSPEALRKYLLVKAGWADTETYPCDTEKEAERLAKILKPMDAYAIIRREGTTVYRFTAKSISEIAMDNVEFQQVKDRALDVLARMLGVTKAELSKAGKDA